MSSRYLMFEILNEIATTILADNYFYLFQSHFHNWGITKWKPRQ